MSTQEVIKVWQDYWTHNKHKELFLDEMSKTIIAELLKNFHDVLGNRFLEAGCGRGMISAQMAAFGAEVHLLDISSDALHLARKHFSSRNLRASFTQGDIFDLPYKDASFDVVWNAGVMEHFENGPQVKILHDIKKIIKPKGFFITFNPFDGAVFYKIGKRSAEKKGLWPYGPEYPVKSLEKQCRTAGLTVLKEYTICFKENLAYFSYVSKTLRSILKIFVKPFPERLLIKLFGGYLLVTVAVRQE